MGRRGILIPVSQDTNRLSKKASLSEKPSVPCAYYNNGSFLCTIVPLSHVVLSLPCLQQQLNLPNSYVRKLSMLLPTLFLRPLKSSLCHVPQLHLVPLPQTPMKPPAQPNSTLALSTALTSTQTPSRSSTPGSQTPASIPRCQRHALFLPLTFPPGASPRGWCTSKSSMKRAG